MHLGDVMKEKVEKAIDDIRPFLMNDGGNIELVKIEDDIVYVSLQGACQNCPWQQTTFSGGVEQLIKEYVPEVKEVRLYTED